MAIVQISRITHRKGLQQDLPQLAAAELGWSIDTRQLYIGNGTISEGAPVEGVTQILTQYSDILNISNNYTFKGTESGYTSITGATALAPTQRTLQNKLDDYVSIRDFGATGDGSTDDTQAIQRAIDEIYFGGFSLNQPRLRRAIHFPPGNYLISSSLKIPSYTILRGSGIDRTTITQTSNLFPVVQLKDSSNQIDAAYGTLSATVVTTIDMVDLTLKHVLNKNVLQLDSCSNMSFTRVAFVGEQSSPNTTATNIQNAVFARPTDATKPISNLRFVDCSFRRCTQGIVLNAYNVKVIGCDFSGMSRAILVDLVANAGTTKNIKIAGSTFDSIARSAVYVNAATVDAQVGVISTGNYYGEIGNNYAGNGAAAYPVLYFNASGNYSVGDAFERTNNDQAVQPRVYNPISAVNASYNAGTGLRTGMAVNGPGRVVSLTASQTNANTGVVLTGSSSAGGAVIDYMLQRPDASAYRKGKIEVVMVGTNVQYTDEYVEYPDATNFTYPGPTGVTLSIRSIGSNKANISYTSNGTGTGTLTYSISTYQL
jgi:hypothetical protein